MIANVIWVRVVLTKYNYKMTVADLLKIELEKTQKELDKLKLLLPDVVGQSEQLCDCGGNERIALDCTMKPCNHPKYYNK